MAQTAQNSEQFSRLQPWILRINIAGLVVLVGLLARKLTQLVRDFRGHVIGSRLKARMVWIFGVLATLPILLVYFFAVQFLNKGIDSWFNVEISRASTTRWCLAARRSRPRMREHLAAPSSSPTSSAIERRRRCRACSRRCAGRSARSSIVVASDTGAVIAVEQGPVVRASCPRKCPGEVLLQVRQGRPFVSLEPQREAAT